jgi:RNA polymerase sigma-70 factor (ECF subfamily)
MSAEVIPISAAHDDEDVAALAAESLYRAHREQVFRYLRAVCGDEDEALDLTALTFERAFRELGRRRGEIGAGWLIRTARNAAIDVARHRRTVDLAEERLARRGTPVLSPDEIAVDGERARRVLSAVAELPRPQRDAIALRYSSDLTVHEIAALIGKSEAATQKLIGRGLDRLKEMLNDLA